MPELPEAQITKQKLKPLIGKKINGFWSNFKKALRVTNSAKKIHQDIKGRKVLKISRQGKVIFLHLSGGRLLAFHMKMSGSLKLKNQNSKVKIDRKHIHARVFFNDNQELLFEDPRKFGLVWYGKENEVKKERYLANLGKDALSVSLKEFLKKFSNKKGMIKTLLLRQDLVCGIGNIIADETLWQAKIHPKSKKLQEKELKNLFSALKKVLKQSLKAKGTTLRNWTHPDSEPGEFQNYMKIYGKKGKNCQRCNHIIQRIKVSNRSTYFCPFCQSYPSNQNKKMPGFGR